MGRGKGAGKRGAIEKEVNCDLNTGVYCVERPDGFFLGFVSHCFPTPGLSCSKAG